MEQDIVADYKHRVDYAQAEIDKYKKQINSYSLLRLAVVALVAVAIYLAVQTIGMGLLIGLFIVLMLCFAWLVSRQSFFEERKSYFTALKAVNENEMASIGDRSNIYNNGSAFADDKHFYTADLDIFGSASLFQLINRAATYQGREKLANWLKAPAQREVILARQQAVKELASKNDWKLDMQARLLFANNTQADQFKTLFAYLHLPVQIPGEKWLRQYIKIAPFLLFGAIGASWFYSPISLLAIAIAIFNMSVLVFRGADVIKSGFTADKIGNVLAKYAIVFKTIEAQKWQGEQLAGLAEKLKTGNTSKNIEELARLINKLSYCAIMIVGFILNVFFLWALKVTIAIEDWKRSNSQNLEESFDTVAGFEAMISLSSLAINYRDWCFAEIAGGSGYTLIAKDLAHPLINRAKRIENDYALDNTFKIDIITGSNMAGKSTFLRTIGINTVLALCGAPACASNMQVSIVTIITYMRIKDSLNESTSTFKAELDRLQMLLKAVDGDEKVFFLIDEMLRSTNSLDKYLGSKAVIEQLIKKNAVGIVATHDLQISELEKTHPNYVRNFNFDIQVMDGEMLFDYKIKQGECKTFNASILLRKIGIEV